MMQKGKTPVVLKKKIGKSKKAKGNKGGRNSNDMDIVTDSKAAKVAQSIGKGKAKRDAAVNQKRGINTTGKASKIDIKKAVAKAGAKSILNAGAKNKNKV